MTIAFTRTETQTAIADSVDALLADRYDFAARRDALADGKGHSPALWSMLADLGLFGIEVEEAAGGIGGSFAETAVVLEAFGRALVVAPFVATAVVCTGLINDLAEPARRKALLEPVVGGVSKLAFAHDEPLGSGVPTTAEKTLDGWRLVGAKSLVLGGNTADLLLVTARLDGDVRLFVVPADASGVTVRGYALYDDSGAADIAIDTILPLDAVIGDAASTSAAIERALDRGAAATVHEAIGAMDRLCAMTPDYLKDRVQFGQPLARFQVLQHRMVDMGMALEQARSMAMLATAALEESNPDVRASEISAAKLSVGDAARFVGQTAVQLHGGIALTDEYPAGHYFKRLTLLARQFGDEFYHLERFARLTD